MKILLLALILFIPNVNDLYKPEVKNIEIVDSKDIEDDVEIDEDKVLKVEYEYVNDVSPSTMTLQIKEKEELVDCYYSKETSSFKYKDKVKGVKYCEAKDIDNIEVKFVHSLKKLLNRMLLK